MTSMEANNATETMLRAFDDLLELYRLLELENELLRGQLRRHTAGELQIREAERHMLDANGFSRQERRERLCALMAQRDAAT
ncbi:hypothetical protein [Dyella sp. ASV21]|uniref:hypothetical protein n=1 Tax=Dyella sp. ASV21 TaxID=2795114 RepID=UPI0018EC6C6C|nr:hypothetical protein [Dyella sp. ASV21]